MFLFWIFNTKVAKIFLFATIFNQSVKNSSEFSHPLQRRGIWNIPIHESLILSIFSNKKIKRNRNYKYLLVYCNFQIIEFSNFHIDTFNKRDCFTNDKIRRNQRDRFCFYWIVRHSILFGKWRAHFGKKFQGSFFPGFLYFGNGGLS